MMIFFLVSVFAFVAHQVTSAFKIHGIPVTFNSGGRRLASEELLCLVRGNFSRKSIGSTGENIHLIETKYLSDLEGEGDGPEIAAYYPDYKIHPKCCGGATEFTIRALSMPSGVKGCIFTKDGPLFRARCKHPQDAWNIASLPNVINVEAVSLGRIHESFVYHLPSGEDLSHMHIPMPRANTPPPTPKNKSTLRKSKKRDGIWRRLAAWPDTASAIVFTDMGLDISHCQISSNGVTDEVVIGQIQDVENMPTWPATHGTMTVSTGIGIGDGCGNTGGVHPGGEFLFVDLTNPQDHTEIEYSPDLFERFTVRGPGRPIRVHSASWGLVGTSGEYGIHSAIVDQHIYDEPGTLHVFAVGNDGPWSSANQLSCAKSVVTVGALNRDGTIASYTSSGDLADGRTSPTVYALGTNDHAAESFMYPPGSPGHTDTLIVTGTSFAAPYIAALAQMEYERRRIHLGLQNIDETLIRAYILGMDKRLTYPTSLSIPPTGDLARGIVLTNEKSWSRCFTAATKTTYTFTMAWADPPGIIGAPRALVNDYDLMIIRISTGEMILGQDALHAFEKMTVEGLNGPYRVVAYPFHQRLISGPLRFSIHARGYGAPNEDARSSTCGSCFPGDVRTCSGGQIQQCLPTGQFSSCMSCERGKLWDGNTCKCSNTVYVRDKDRFLRGCGEYSPQPFIKSGESTRNVHNLGPFAVLAILIVIY